MFCRVCVLNIIIYRTKKQRLREAAIITLLIKADYEALIKIDGKIADFCRGNTLKVELPQRYVYFIEAVYISKGELSLCPRAVSFYPEQAYFDCAGARLTKYSASTFLLEFIAEQQGGKGFYEPVQQIRFRQGDISHTATLYLGGINYIELENEDCLMKKQLGFNITKVSLAAENLTGGTVAAVYGSAGDKKYSLFIGYGDDYKTLGEFYSDSCEVSDKKIIIKNTYRDMAAHREEIVMDYDGRALKTAETKRSAQKPRIENDKLVPYYFLEAMLSGNYDEAIGYLDKNSYSGATAEQLKNYFGEFTEALQNIYDEKLADYTAVKKHTAKSFYELCYYDFKVKGGFIENIIAAE